MYENKNLEFKREYTDNVKKAIVAFANCEGGTVYIGIEDDGSKVGVADVDETLLQLSNTIRDAISPDLTMFVQYDVIAEKKKSIIKVIVSSGTAKPYYLKSKGIRPEGVFVRQGASSVPATEAAILHMIQETSGYSYERERSLVQNLNFHKAKEVFAKEKVSFGETQYRTLGIIGEDKMYTNLGLLLSDECPHIIRLAVFEGKDKLVFKDRFEAEGSVLKQLEDAFLFIDKYNRTRSEFPALYRQDIRDYPVEAIREALLNAIVHRDYSFSGSTLISIFDDRIEFVNIGGLLKGISYNDILLGVSASRNKKLADVFYRLHLIEAYGTGLLKIKKSYAEQSNQVKIAVSDNAFKITLPNINYAKEKRFAVHESIAAYGDTSKGLSATESKIMELVNTKEAITREDVQQHTGLSLSGAIKCLKSLQEKGMLQKMRQGRSILYYH